MNKVLVCFPRGKTKVLTMSYDDGGHQDERLVAIFNKCGIRCTFNLSYGFLAQGEAGGHIPPERINSLYAGHEIASHTLNHPTLPRLPKTAIAEEILEDRKALERITGKVIRGHAYPNGRYNEDIKKMFSSLGVAYARTITSTGEFELPTDLMEWNPTCHHNDPELMEKAKFFADFAKKQYLKLMYVWGHSYEFDLNDNWNVIEEFCEYMGGREDIWYATNMEIAEYMDVLDRLQFTAACDGVYNPSAKSAFLNVNDRIVEVPGGEYVAL